MNADQILIAYELKERFYQVAIPHRQKEHLLDIATRMQPDNELPVIPAPRGYVLPYDDLQDRVNEWYKLSFGDLRTFKEIDDSLARETVKLFEAKTQQEQMEKAAEIVILLLGRAALLDTDLLKTVKARFEDKKGRAWHTPGNADAVEHEELAFA